jgi:uncharacterized protein (DUF952 family)
MILHITTVVEWNEAKRAGRYTCPSLEKDGFIHCSTKEQVIEVANALFRGEHGLVLLCIDPARVEAQIVYEDLYATGKQFPHVYGALNLDAVVDVLDFTPNSDGEFTLPDSFD